MKHTIHHCMTRDDQYIPARLSLVFEASTAREAIEYLETHGGGIYRNVLHNLEFRVNQRE